MILKSKKRRRKRKRWMAVKVRRRENSRFIHARVRPSRETFYEARKRDKVDKIIRIQREEAGGIGKARGEKGGGG